ncbi:MAG: response regulator, partial [Bacteroidia bacterium]
AIANYERSLAVWLHLNNKQEAFRPLFNIGHAYHDKKQYVKALGYYQRALELAGRLGLSREKMTIYGNMAEVYYDLNEHKQAADYFRRYIEIKDSVQSKDIKDYTLELDKQFKAEENKTIIQKQRLELAEQDLKLEQQNKRLYLSLLVVLLLVVAAVFIVVYFNFQKRLNEKTEEAKKKFFSNVVHEIRTPLSMIQAPLKVLRTRLNSPEELNNIELAERNIQRLNELVNQMLDISKIDAVKYSLNETFGDLESFFIQFLGNYKKLAADKNIALVHQYNIQHKVAFFDKDALEKIAGNLLGNAIKYTPNGQRVGIDADTEETEQGIQLTLSVWDTGPGIPEKEQEKIFNRFYRSEKTAANTKGVGIGLALVKDLIELQKGSIVLKSREAKGSTFTVTLQLRTKEAPQLSDAPAKSLNEHAPLILVVEDDADILEFNATYLEQNKFRVLKARHGKEALALLEKTLPDLVITDLMMPELDGLGLLKLIRGNSESDHIPVIILSAKAAPESRVEALKAGAQGYLVKPFLPEELVSVVTNQLEILGKKKTEFRELIAQPEKKTEEKFTGTEPYTQKLFALIFKQLDDPELSVEKLADQMATNRSHFQRKVKTITGFSPSEIIRAIRLEKAKELLLARNGNITEVAYQTGFSSQSYFTKCFTQQFGLSPTQLLQNAK